MMRSGGGGGGGHFRGFRTPGEKPSGRVPVRNIGRRIISLFGPYRRQVATVFGLIIVTATIGVFNPILIKPVFDSIFCSPGCPHMGWVLFFVGLMVVLPIVNSAISIFQTLLTNTIGQRVMEDLRNVLYEHLQGMSLRFFTGTRTGEIQSRLTNDVGGIQDVITETASTILSNIVILISTVIAMAILSWQLTVLSLCLTPLFIFLTYRAGTARRRLAALAQRSKADMSAITEETLSVSGMLLVKVFGRQKEEAQRFRDENRTLADVNIKQVMVGRVLFAVVNIFFSTAPAFVYLLAAMLVSQGNHSITPGTIVAFTTLQSRLFFPVGQMLQVSVEVQSSLALFERIFEYLDMPHDITDVSDAIDLDPAKFRGEVELRQVAFRYEKPLLTPSMEADGVHHPEVRAWAIEDLSLHVQPGQLAAIVGPSGAGKTTISYLIPRLYDVTEGSVLLDEIDVRHLQQAAISKVVGMVTQETYLFHASVRRNLLYAKPDATDEELQEAARAAFIHDRIMELRDGYDTVVGERGYRMSGGEKQRLAIARVILKSPRILILDEATSALDSTSERLVQAALRPLMKGRTTIAIAHRLSTILAADVIFVLDRGRLVEQGKHEELVRRGGLYAQLYQQQFHGGEVEAVTEDGVVLASGKIVSEAEAS